MTTPIQREVAELMKLVDAFGDCLVQLEDIYDEDVEREMDLHRQSLRTLLTTLLTRLRAAEAVAVAAKAYRDCPPGRGIEKNAKGIALDTALAAWEKKS